MIVSLLSVLLAVQATEPLPRGAVGRLGTTRFKHPGGVVSVTYLPDGKSLISAGWDGSIRVWEAASGREIRRIGTGAGSPVSAALSPDGKLLATCARGSRRLWDVRTGRLRWEQKRPVAESGSPAFSANGRILAWGGWTYKSVMRNNDQPVTRITGYAEFVDRPTRKTVARFTIPHSRVGRVFLSPDGTLAAFGVESSIRVIELPSGRMRIPLERHTNGIRALAISPDGTRLASGSVDGEILVWDLPNGKLLRTLKAHTDAVYAVVFSPDGKRIASGGPDQTIRLFDADTGKALLQIPTGSHVAWGLEFRPDGKVLASAGARDDTIRFWNSSDGQEVSASPGHRSKVLAVAISPDGKTLASCGADGRVLVWDVAARTQRLALEGHERAVNSVAFSPDGSILVSGGDDATVRAWSPADGKEIHRSKPFVAKVKAVAIAPDGKLVAVGTNYTLVAGNKRAPGEVRLLDAGTWKEVRRIKAHAFGVVALAFSPDGKRLAVAGGALPIRLFDPATGDEISILTAVEPSVRITSAQRVGFSSNGRLLACGTSGGTIITWNAVTGRKRLRLHDGPPDQTSVAFTPDGALLVSGGADGLVRLWDLSRGKKAAAFTGHRGAVRAVAVFPDGRTIASAGADSTVLLWKLR